MDAIENAANLVEFDYYIGDITSRRGLLCQAPAKEEWGGIARHSMEGSQATEASRVAPRGTLEVPASLSAKKSRPHRGERPTAYGWVAGPQEVIHSVGERMTDLNRRGEES